MPGEQRSHHGERGAREPLGAALDWLEERSGAGPASPATFRWLLSGTEPFIVVRVFSGHSC